MALITLDRTQIYCEEAMARDHIRRGRLTEERNASILHFLSSKESDRWIADADVLVDLAHLVMLHKQRLIGDNAARALADVLLDLHEHGLPERVFDEQFEDVHAGIEAYLIDRVGADFGGRMHLGRSRNDEVATCSRIRLREELFGEMEALLDLRHVLIERADEHIDTIMPGFTHLQHAQPVTLAHHLLAYEEAFGRDYARLSNAYARVNISPLGAAAFASTGFAIDRRYTQELLGFAALATNTMDAVAARDYALEVLADNAILLATVSRFCEEIVLWSSPLIGFVHLADPYCSSSSIMPQKKNPDTAEVMRAKAASSAGELVAALGCIKGLPMSYNRDLQELWPHLWHSVADVRSSLPLLAGMVKSAMFDTARMAEEAGRGFSTATELADVLVREYDLPFRTAHTIVGRAVRSGTLGLAGIEAAARSIAGISLVERGLSENRIAAALDVRTVVNAKQSEGGPASSAVRTALAERRKLLAQDRMDLKALRDDIAGAQRRLIAKAQELAGI